MEYLEDSSDEVEIAPPRKNREDSPGAVSLIQAKIDEFQDAMFRQLALERKLNDPKVQDDAVKRAADDFMQREGKIIRDAANVEHEKQVADLKSKYADIERREQESLKGARRAREQTVTQERDRLKRVRDEIISSQAKLNTTQEEVRVLREKRRKLEKDTEDLRKRASVQAQSYGSFRPRAQKGPAVSSYMSSMYGN